MTKTKSAHDRHNVYQNGARGFGYNPTLREWELYEMDKDGSIQDLSGRVRSRAEALAWAGVTGSHVRMFKPEFAPLVEAGTKCQTVRPIPSRRPKPGEAISLRTWTGKPYRSKQRILAEAIITEVALVRIEEGAISINGKRMVYEEAFKFAQADGFTSVRELLDWFRATHGLPFSGIVIKWRKFAEVENG